MTRLTVAIRVRPLSERELSCKSVSIVSIEDGKTVAVTNTKVPEQNAGDSRERVRRFNFDYCFNYTSSQEDVYRKIEEELVGGLRAREHSCILAYGQSASGKTHTMIGDAPDDAGVVPRFCQRLFRYLVDAAIGSELEHVDATVSFLEIYNEKVRDLLNPNAGNVLLKVREHPRTGPYVQGLSEQRVADSDALLSLLHAGSAHRTVGATNANPRSSRSHSVFTITCLGGVKLKFVDLAGSERAGSHTASRLREGANINKSLVALRSVISALADWSKASRSKRQRFVPYRDSVLTWLLKDTLGGNSKTILISTVSPASTCYTETVNTLRFGQRAKLIAVQPPFTEDPKEKTIRELLAEIAKLRELLDRAHKPLPSAEPTPDAEAKHESDSDSGVSVCEDNNFDDEAALAPQPPAAPANDSATKVVGQNEYGVIAVEKLYPLMDVTTTMGDPPKGQPRPLQRTFSGDQQPDARPTKRFSAQDAPPANGKHKTSGTPTRKLSADAANLSPKRGVPKKIDAKSKIDSRPKVDSHRRALPKPRAQIVAAVTQRLYNKVKRKEVATDTLDLSRAVPALSITSKARLRLQELTQQALKAHRRKHVETQTNLFPVRRFKETATDVDDLRLLGEEVADAHTATDVVMAVDATTNCTFVETLQLADAGGVAHRKATIILTRSCGTCTDRLDLPAPAKPFAEEKPALSFTKYLMPQQQAPTFEIVNAATANPIYTSSVNINVNHNYARQLHEQQSEALSDDSLDGSAPIGSVCFPTPDLISNHNSLEPHASPACTNTTAAPLNSCGGSNEPNSADMRYATSAAMEDNHLNSTLGLLPDAAANHGDVCVAVANCAIENSHRARASVETQYAPQTCVRDAFDDDYDIFYKAPPQKYRSNIAHDRLHEPLQPSEPVILKSIMKCSDAMSDDCDSESAHAFDHIPDSLNYYYEKERKTVRFDSPTLGRSAQQRQDGRMMDVMAEFMKEVTALVTNLTKAASRLEVRETEYDMHVVVNDVRGLNTLECDRCSERPTGATHLFTESTQTLPISTSDCATDMEFDEMPANKFEALLEASCKRLETTIQRTMANERRDVFNVRGNPPASFAHVPDWHYRNAPDVPDSSLESQPTFSDYGSLPRRRTRASFSGPSSYLRQLTNMRREIVRTSRDELLQEADIHL